MNKAPTLLMEQTNGWMRSESGALSATACLESVFSGPLSLDAFGVLGSELKTIHFGCSGVFRTSWGVGFIKGAKLENNMEFSTSRSYDYPRASNGEAPKAVRVSLSRKP